MPLPTRKPFRPNPTTPPPLTRGAPIVGTDPTTPAAATPDPREAARQAAIAEAKRKSQAKYAAGGFTPPESDVGDLASLQQQHDRERAAAQHDLAASKAQALQTAAAKSGSAGFGLSGASAALQGDVGSAADRNSVLTMADLRGKQNDENFTELQREVALSAAEEADDTDYNKDGMINGVKVGGKVGDHNPDNNGKPPPPPPAVTPDQILAGSPALGLSRKALAADPNNFTETRTAQGIHDGDQYFGSDASFDYWMGVGRHPYKVPRHAGRHAPGGGG